MIDIKLLEKKPENGQPHYFDEYTQCLKNRSGSEDNLKALERLMKLSVQRKEMISLAEVEKAKQNKLSAEVGLYKREGRDASTLLSEVDALKTRVKELEGQAAQGDESVQQLLLTLPNKLHASVPVGQAETHNEILKSVGVIKTMNFKPREHHELGEKLDVLDFERAGKTTGTRFTFLKGAAARMERSLIQLMMDIHSNEHGYTEMIPPFIVNSKSLLGTGNFPKFKDEVFHLADSDYYLIPTAEVPVTNYYAGETLNEIDLPRSFCAYSPCFRSEAGSHGRDTKGLIRQHQFDKVELMTFCHPSQSYEMHERLTTHAERILVELELPFRRVLLCSGDTGFGSARTHDLEVWLPGQNAYREISSCSNFEDFQARRANIRFKPKDGGKPQFVHTLNGSGLAVGRTLIAILENYQREDGSIEIPLALRSYMGNKAEIR